MRIKISKKFTLSIASVTIFVTIISMVINVFFIERFYMFKKTRTLDQISEQINRKKTDYIFKNIDEMEKKNDVTIVYSEASSDINNINEDLITKFSSNKIKLNKFWLTEDTLSKLNSKSINKIYDQGVTKYKVLTKFIKVDKYIFAIAMPLPYMGETIDIINKFNIYLNIFSLILIIILVGFFSKKIIKPLELIKELSKDIANLNFRKEEIKTNDEIEELAISINSMSESLEQAHKEINFQNEKLKTLISDMAHEVKTPLALIKAYGQGIEDGLDDGTYMGIINEQIDHMDSLVENLLFLSKLEKKELKKANFSLKRKFSSVLKKYKLLIDEANINFISNINKDEEYIVYGDEEGIDIVLNNLITNAIKYTNNNEVEVEIVKEDNKTMFSIKNGLEESSKEDLENIWTPFYVLEKSRSKELSGTGLGLSIVKKILEKHNLDFGFNVKQNKIEFCIIF
ncbi:HAMP domain-containing histidine kinase [Clostridium sp. CM027]|uniref:HAMP domain-containing sensor histidine kinase n=1 Tax=Clostridium sp. CM027 TaxID=2849865 RepID=UPI001C6EC916|nr:HAMP domain-containing sensor histidine kinase [Clostridium sp. CM027]MBW9146505.1 HAMP domain-containing histidine kinase [Clostridium sp. CM027]UVE39612.1 HAMP domain-containing histidine kinase [Clostridium sp. CM027]